MGPLARFLLVVGHFVCPLLFFTDLTRNPYFTQIALLNVCLLGAALFTLLPHLKENTLRLPSTPVDIPWAAWLAVCLFSWAWAYGRHIPFFRPSIAAEGTRAFVFTFVNALLPFYLAAAVVREAPSSPDIPAGRWAAATLGWGLLWLAFSVLRSPGGMPLLIASHVWDPFGALAWAAGLAIFGRLAWGATAHHFWHLALAVGFLGSAYGVCQYFNAEFLWPKALNPYGGRSVSTFGNPNFMSSYMVMLLPLALAYYLRAKSSLERIVYSAAFLTMEACLLASLTRSSWIGAAAAIAFLFLFRQVRGSLRLNREWHGLLIAASVAMLLFWPQSSVGGYAPSVYGRIQELGAVLDAKSASHYSPLYQRFLIWSCAWLMGGENPLWGKGWGLFELFYPFYQGPILSGFEFFRGVRTHANNAHNEVLEVWAQTGILGVGVLLWMWRAFFASFLRWIVPWQEGPLGPAELAHPRFTRPREAKPEPGAVSAFDPVWIAAAAAGVVGMLVDNLLNVSLHFAVPAFLFWWQAGCVMARPVHLEGRWRVLRFPRRWAARLAGLAAVVGCLWIGWWWVRLWNREVRYFLGFKLLRTGHLAPALDFLHSAYRWHSREVNTNYEMGNAYARSGLFDKASWAYQEALRANAGYDEIYFNLGTVIHQKLGRPEEALKYYRAALAINPLSAEAATNLAVLYLQNASKYAADAEVLLRRASRIFPNHVLFRSNLGYLYSVTGRPGQAIEAWSGILRDHPDERAVEQNLRDLASRSGLPVPPILAQLGAFRELEGRIARRDYSEATLASARKLSAAFPESVKVGFYRGNLELMHGHPEKSLELLEPIARLDSANPVVQRNLGEAYLQLGRTEQAKRAFRAALTADPSDDSLRQRMAQLGLE
ncbi:MAG: tetratricopeptide repeat protein [Elusimicrobia bacterium]|nr:tetratricopeptide repeat protein [Elusimicrobiota bacterium]